MTFDRVSLDRPTCLILSTAVFCLLLTVLAVKANNAQADPQHKPEIINASIPQPEIHPAQTLLKEQLTAVKARNADLAFSYLSDNLHQDYQSAKEYLNEIRFDHRPMYNYETFEFLDRHTQDGNIIQRVLFKDSYSGESFTGIFRLVQTEEQQWKIDSFAILEQEASPI